MTDAQVILELLARAKGATPPRVYYPTNPVPVGDNVPQNAPTHDYMRSKGWSPVFFAYEGTLNRAGWWSKAGVPTVPAYIDRSQTDLAWGEDANHSAPPTRTACHAVARLAMDAKRFVPDCPADVLPLCFDLENHTVGIDIENGTPDQWNASLRNIVNPLEWAREVNPVSDLSHWALLPFTARNKDNLARFWDLPLARRVVDLVAYMVPWVYHWDLFAVTPALAIEAAYLEVEGARKVKPDAKPVLCVDPFYAIRAESTHLDHLRGKAVNPEAWGTFVGAVGRFGCDVMCWAEYEDGGDVRRNIDLLGEVTAGKN